MLYEVITESRAEDSMASAALGPGVHAGCDDPGGCLSGLIESNPHRTHKELFTNKGSGAKIVLQETFNAREEGSWIVNKIAEMIMQKTAESGDS